MNAIFSRFWTARFLLYIALPLATTEAGAAGGDGKADLVFQYSNPGLITTWFMDGINRMGNTVNFNPNNPGDAGWRIVATGDFNRDGNVDLLWQHTNGDMSVWYMNGINLISPTLLNPSNPGNPGWRVVATGDFNRDGKVDLLFQFNDPYGMMSVWHMNGVDLIPGGNVLVNPEYPGTDWKVRGTADFNRDGHVDILFQHLNNTLSVWHMNDYTLPPGGNVLTYPSTVSDGWLIKATGDFNFDAKPDIAFQHTSGLISPWFMSGTSYIGATYFNPSSAPAGYAFVATGDFGSNAPLDTDYDGRSDAQELADGTDPNNPESVLPTRLGYWRFNTSDFSGESGEFPLVTANVASVISFDGNGVQVVNSGARLKYRDVENNGKANINLRQGSIRFQFKPDWSSASASGTGPGTVARLIEVGTETPDARTGWWCLFLSANGNTITFATQGNGLSSAKEFTGQVFLANSWHEITLTYSPSASFLYQFDIKFAPKSGVEFYPSAEVRAQGFRLGSDENGSRRANGVFDELETFNYELGDVGSLSRNNVLSATVTTQPPKIDLSWRHFGGQTNTVERRLPGESSWVALSTSPSWSYSDSSPELAVGQRYEYRLMPFGDHGAVWLRHIHVGIDAPPIHDRGRLILLVDSAVASLLATELDVLKTDLVGDGWTVIRQDVARHNDADWSANVNNITAIRASVASIYNSYPDPSNTKAIFIVGHVAVPYSGFGAEDGHTAQNDSHAGAWPTDLYYGDVDGIWTDNTNNPAVYPPRYAETTNEAGDGKFDQDYVPANQSGIAKIEMAVGRIDFAKMPVFNSSPPPGVSPVSEIELLRRYLNKTHNYRHKLVTLPNRVISAGIFVGTQAGGNRNIHLHAQGNGSAWFGLNPTNVIPGNIFRDNMEGLVKKSALWGMQGGPGDRNVIGTDFPETIYYSSDLANPANEPPIGFYLLEGSWFGDWNLLDNFMRATLGTPTYGYATMWAKNLKWRFELLAQGQTLGDSQLHTTENVTGDQGAVIKRTLEIMGDPTLRLRVTAPPANLIATANGSDVILNWTGSPDASGYYVYRSVNGLDGPWINLGFTSINSFTDSNAPAGSKMYRVRAAQLITSGSGSYMNLSQGIFAAAN